MWLYLAPTLIINVVVILVPALLTVCLAFFQWDGISAPVFIGLGNFIALYDDRVFWTALSNNLDLDGDLPDHPDRHGAARRQHAADRAAARPRPCSRSSISCR